MSILSKPYFHNEPEAFAKLEEILWPEGATCPHCGSVEKLYRIKPNPAKKVRLGLWKCGNCKGQFTVKVGTVFESSHVPLYKWLQAIYLMSASKKGISAHQLHRTLEVTYKTAWFMAHRLREAMKTGPVLPPLGGKGKTVEADETFLWNKKGAPVKRGYQHKNAIAALVERGATVRTFHVDKVNAKTLLPIIQANADPLSAFMTDEAKQYISIGARFAEHGVVNHSAGEYVRGSAHTNTLEGYFSIFKRGMKGIYQHCSEKHLHRYLAEFDFRYNYRVKLGYNDEDRTNVAILGAVGKRLQYVCKTPG